MIFRKKKKGEPDRSPPGASGLSSVSIGKVRHCMHRGEPVKVGPYTILAGGTRDLFPSDLDKAEVLVPLLDSSIPFGFGKSYRVLAAPLRDFGGVPDNWREFLEEQLIPLLDSGAKVLTFCMGSHGRTGTLIASLIALLESPEETPDPIAAARKRHCDEAVETREQAAAVFELRGEDLPLDYEMEFYRPPPKPYIAPASAGIKTPPMTYGSYSIGAEKDLSPLTPEQEFWVEDDKEGHE
jgi:hypothetical protein